MLAITHIKLVEPVCTLYPIQVHVATVDLKPTFEYDTVPKLAQHAFLRAKVTNDSHYPFLAGPANVFLDQSYVTETTLSSVSPSEEFSCSLGEFGLHSRRGGSLCLPTERCGNGV